MVRLLHYADLETAYDTPERIGRLAGTIDRVRGPDALVVGGGDTTGPGALALATEGEQALAFFQAVDPVADVIGNHDLDHGPERFLELAAASPQRWLAANITDDGDRFGADAGVDGSIALECGDTSVGLVGVTDPDTPSMCPPAAALEFSDPIEAVTVERSKLDTDHVVVLSHVGRGEAAIARECDVDAVLGGHVHEARVEWIDGTVCARPGANARTVLGVDLDAGRVARHDVADGPVAVHVKRGLEEHLAAAGLDEVVATVEGTVERTRAVLRDGEAAVGNFVADAYRWATGADVGLQNTPGLRTGPPLSGEVTRAELIGLVPFDARVVVAELSGRRLRTVLGQGEGERLAGLGEYWYAQVSGVEVERGDEIGLEVGGEPLDLDATYRLATTDFLCRTDAEFPALEEGHVVDRAGVQHEVVLEYAREVGVDPALEGRIGKKA